VSVYPSNLSNLSNFPSQRPKGSALQPAYRDLPKHLQFYVHNISQPEPAPPSRSSPSVPTEINSVGNHHNTTPPNEKAKVQ